MCLVTNHMVLLHQIMFSLPIAAVTVAIFMQSAVELPFLERVVPKYSHLELCSVHVFISHCC